MEFIIQDGTENTTSGNWILPFDGLEQQSGLCVEDASFFQQLIRNMLCERPEAADLSIDENGFDVTCYLDFCRNFEPETEAVQTDVSRQKLRELICTPLADVHLVHKEVDIDPATIVELSANTLTDAGKQAWADVLEAKVCRIYGGAYGLQVELKGVKPSRLQDFSTMLAGYCSEESYEKWVAQTEEVPAQSPDIPMKNTTLTLSFNTEKLDALTFHMGKKDADLQGELNDTIQKLYEKYVPQATREYIDDKVSRDAEAKDRPRRPARPAPLPADTAAPEGSDKCIG